MSETEPRTAAGQGWLRLTGVGRSTVLAKTIRLIEDEARAAAIAALPDHDLAYEAGKEDGRAAAIAEQAARLREAVEPK